jgi:hypothetical protein
MAIQEARVFDWGVYDYLSIGMVARVRGDVRLVRATLRRCLQCNSLDWVSLLLYTHDNTDRGLAV